MPGEPVTRTQDHLDAGAVADVMALARAVAQADGVAPLSEAFTLALGPARPGVTHVLRDAGFGATGTPTARLVGYAQVAGDACELCVAPAERRHGHGLALAEAARSAGARRFWSHGDPPAARALAARLGLVATRTLHRMCRPLTSADRADLTDPAVLGLPAGMRITTFEHRDDVEMLQRLNAAAFASHPEQGRLGVSDLRERMAEPWFDAAGLFLLLDAGAPVGADPIGFHWTKITPGGHIGEVYVVGIHPAFQGRGLAGPLTRLGLAHLVERGCREVELYVDGENTRAVATYRRLGFEVVETHVVYEERSAAAPPADLTR